MAVLKISLGYFSFNILVAMLSLVFDSQIIEFVINFIPFKGTIPSIIGFLIFTRIDTAYLQWYQVIIDLAIVAFAMFEVTQVVHVTFKLTRFLQSKVDSENGLCQWAVLCMITLCGTSVFVLAKYAIIDRLGILFEAEQPFPWITVGFLAFTIVILVALPALMEGQDAIIPNGLAVAAYVALMTS